jgi:hypothetical protein
MSAQGRDPGTAEARPAGLPPRRTAGRIAKDIILFFAGPLITVAYLALFPFIGLRMLIQGNKSAPPHQNDAG